MDAQHWISRCAARLHRVWPTLAQADLDEVAEQLFAEPRWRDLPPEQAAVDWLRLGAIVA
jgi:hypothetical protein